MSLRCHKLTSPNKLVRVFTIPIIAPGYLATRVGRLIGQLIDRVNRHLDATEVNDCVHTHAVSI